MYQDVDFTFFVYSLSLSLTSFAWKPMAYLAQQCIYTFYDNYILCDVTQWSITLYPLYSRLIGFIKHDIWFYKSLPLWVQSLMVCTFY